jgi:hypothetical protein
MNIPQTAASVEHRGADDQRNSTLSAAQRPLRPTGEAGKYVPAMPGRFFYNVLNGQFLQ